MRAGWLVVGVAAVVLLTGCQEDATGAAGPSPAVNARPASPEVVTPARPAAKPATVPGKTAAGTADAALLRAAANGDGDSWKDTRGVEYRLGLVNTPELSECFGQAASRKRKQLTATGFRATSYTVDTYGRRVSVVFLADGRNLNVWLARNGYANDKYLAEFRQENPSLAAQLDAAFAAAKREHAGLWGACSPASQGQVTAPSPQPAAPVARGNCDASYPDVCIPPAPPDLDCGDVSARRFRVLAPDPHRFDADHDGLGCESG